MKGSTSTRFLLYYQFSYDIHIIYCPLFIVKFDTSGLLTGPTDGQIYECLFSLKGQIISKTNSADKNKLKTWVLVENQQQRYLLLTHLLK